MFSSTMLDHPNLLDEVCRASSCRLVVLGALGIVQAVHGSPCRDEAGVAVDPAGGRIFDAGVADLVTGSDAIRGELFDGLHRVMVGGRPFDKEYRSNESRGGGWCSLRVYALGAGPIVIVVRDVTARKRAELARNRLGDFSRLARVAASVGIWDLNLMTGSMYIDPVLKALLGYRDREIPNGIDAWRQLVDPRDRGMSEVRLREHVEGRSKLYEVEHRMVRRDGVRLWFLSRGLLIERRDDRPYRIVGMDTDITKCKEAELALLVSQERYGLATRAGQIGVGDLDLETGELVTDDVFAQIFGVESTPGWTRTSWLERVHPDDRSRIAEHETQHMRPDAPRDPHGHTQMTPIEYRILHPDGEVHTVSTHARIVRADDGRPMRVVGVTMDVTVRRRSEAALRASRRRLRHRNREIRSLTTQLTVAQETERRRIARELHDDISQRIAAVAIIASDTRRRTSGGAAADALDDIQVRLSDLAGDIRRLSHSMSPPAIGGQDLRDRLTAYVAELYRYRKLRVRLQVRDLPDKVPNDAADCLFRVAQEALWNVARHAGATRAGLLVYCAQERLHIDISDEGRGFDPLHAEGSVGFGLVSMKQRVEQLGGTLEIEAHPGGGTRIHASVPLPT